MLVSALVAGMAVFTFGGLPTAAHAAGTPVTDEAGLTTALSTSGVDPTVTVSADYITVTADSLFVERTVTLDLAGNSLYAHNIHLNAGVTLTIIDSSVDSTGQLFAYSATSTLAGITTTGATLNVSSGTITASGGSAAAAIGGDDGPGGNGGTVNIGPAGTAHAGATAPNSAIGAGPSGTSFGSLEVNGLFTLSYGEFTVPTGTSVTGTGTITSWGHITNNGTILPTIGGNGNVSGNNFYINLAGNFPDEEGYAAYHLYAPTFQDAGVAFPDPDRGPGVSLTKWTSEPDGTGTTLTQTTPLTGLSSIAFYAQWATSGITAISVDYDGSPSSVQAGYTELSAAYTVGADTWDISDLVTFDSDVDEDTFDSGYYGAYIEAGPAGPRTVTGSLTSDTDVSDTMQFEVVHSEAIADIALAMTPTTVFAGRNSTAYLSAVDSYDNAFGYNILLDNPCDWCDFTLTSSDPTDVIDLSTGTITLTTLGTHTITASIDMGEGGFVTAEATVTVVAPPAALAATGYELDQAPWAALLLLLLGLTLLWLPYVVRRRA